ncbi:MAG: hypothetical protein WCS42_00070 [Verrucomicrobiota bacterium]
MIAIKYRVYILAVIALISGLFMDLVPLPFNAWVVVIMGFFPVLFNCAVIFLWDGVSLWRRTMLLLGACLLGFGVCEITVVLRNGFRVLGNLSPGLILLLIQFGTALGALAVAHLTLRLMRRRDA